MTKPTSKKKRPRNILLIVIGVLIAICCLCTLTDNALRSVGLLPTHTPTASITPTATATATSTRTPTRTPRPTKTATPTRAPTPTITPSPTITPGPSPTPRPTNTLAPTRTPAPTNTPTGPRVVITAKDKVAEYVDITNTGDQPQDLSGWTLVSEKGNQGCALAGVLVPGQTLRVWANNPGAGGYNCGFGNNIWNNDDPDPAVLYNARGQEVSRK